MLEHLETGGEGFCPHLSSTVNLSFPVITDLHCFCFQTCSVYFLLRLNLYGAKTHSRCPLLCVCLLRLNRNSSSLKMLMSRTRRTCRATWTEWSPTPGSWSLKSRTMQTRVRTSTQAHTFNIHPVFEPVGHFQCPLLCRRECSS